MIPFEKPIKRNYNKKIIGSFKRLVEAREESIAGARAPHPQEEQ